MRSITIISVALLVIAVQAGPVKDDARKTLNTGETMMMMKMGTEPGIKRDKRDCGVADLDKIQAKIIVALERQIELLLGGHVHEGGNKTRRAITEAAAGSTVNTDGSIKSTAAAKANNDPMASAEDPLLTNGHQLMPGKKLSEESGASTPVDILPPPPPPPPPASEPAPLMPPPPPQGGAHPVAGTGNIVQKVASKANMEKGTAVASAIAKRAAVVQTVETSGGKAVANAESHKGADTNVQSVTANGTHVGIANAVVDNTKAVGKVKDGGPEVVLQNVAATGNKAVATATNNKGSGSGVQEASAVGEEIAIASTSSEKRTKREIVVTSLDEIPEDDSIEDVVKSDDDEGMMHSMMMHERVTRSPCISTKMDDNLRKLINDTVVAAFVELKKELKL